MTVSFAEPMVFVNNLTKENIEKAMERIVAEDGDKWLTALRCLTT
jgi:hypothetical protein